MIPAPETCPPNSTQLGRPLAIALIAGALLATASAGAIAQASAPAASASRAAHASVKAQPAAKKKKKAKPAAVRDDDAPDSFVYGRRDDVLAFAAQVAEDRGLDRAWVEDQLARARYQPSVAKAIMPGPAGTAKNWAAYRARFVEPKRLAAGVAWWQAHAATLADAQQRYGVPPEIVAGVVGVESFYGRMTGNYRVLDALATLAFDFPSGRSDRSAFYRSELRAYLVWCALEGRDADTTRGSFAGAIGWPQFMPSSILRFAVDDDHDGHVDLASGGDDVVGSIAGYLARFGWQRDLPTTFAVLPPVDPVARARLVAADIVPSFTAAQLAEAGAQLPDDARAFTGPLAFVELQNGDNPASYVLGTSNFYVVTRYNWSAYYAMAVIDLGAALKREMALAPAARTIGN
ncbi:lytic murein transglycosylase B [Scleromatobacter humisilvae]|uniref:Lytic murein transglycosylase B n=1 Tax=Scleromatobacter humisilvae TaxID=2897159 RepID=A0A9X1YNL8_9BURK|nr:lytic murein transglycosylase B [Scleromatobacter humisilvae]MCK9689127.1 lytic murein transglycosylase B [Scleromatobacter humisilvae]